jgi:hypothetical protein
VTKFIASEILLWRDGCQPRREKKDERTVYFELAERARRLGNDLRALCVRRSGGKEGFAASSALIVRLPLADFSAPYLVNFPNLVK